MDEKEKTRREFEKTFNLWLTHVLSKKPMTPEIEELDKKLQYLAFKYGTPEERKFFTEYMHATKQEERTNAINLLNEAGIKARKDSDEKNTVSFRGVELLDSEAKILEDLEVLLNKQFKSVDQIKERTQMGFMAEDLRIKGLGLADCSLGTFPESILNLQNLEILTLFRNGLTSLPSNIHNLTMLKSLNLTYNSIRNLPESIGNLISLRNLSLEGNQGLSSLPESITNLKFLKTLVLYHCIFLSFKKDKILKNIFKLLKKNGTEILI